MTDYVRGTVLGTATTLPITGASIYFLVNRANLWVVMGLLAVNVVATVMTMTQVYRFFVNRNRYTN